MDAKHPILAGRVRRPPPEGFSWVDRRFVREHAQHLGRDAILLYFFLAAVGDKQGLSFWSDGTVAARLGLEIGAVRRARDDLIAHDLVAHKAPLSQVLSLPPTREARRDSRGPCAIAEILRESLQRPPEAAP
jgi:hypothetical protein